MKSFFCYLSLTFISLALNFLNSQELIERDVYIVIGQSNAAGRASIESIDEEVLTSVDLFNGNDWVAASNPMNAYSNIFKGLGLQQLNFAYSFSKKINEITNNRVGMIVNARGGTSIDQWQKNAEAGYFESTIERITAAANTPGTTIKGILWHQGESDVRNTNYLTSLQNLIDDLRTAIGDNTLPFIAGQITQENENHTDFNENITLISNYTDFTDFVTSEDLTTTDGLHFDSSSQRTLGERYADKIEETILNNLDLYTNTENSQFKIYPVPCKQKLNITSEIGLTNVIIIDMQGKQVISKKLKNKKRVKVNTANLKSGNYTVKITTSNSDVINKLFIKN